MTGVSLFRTHGLMMLVCVQATFLIPYIVVVPGERTNIFTSLLTILPLLQVAFGCIGCGRIPWKPLLCWSLLAMGVTVSAVTSLDPAPALWRALSFIAPAASGFACGYIMFCTKASRSLLFNILTACFAGLAVVHLLGGTQPSSLGLHHHAIAGMLVLLAAGPIHMLGEASLCRRILAFMLMLAGAVVCFIAGSRFVVLLPFVLIPIYMYLRRITIKGAVSLLAMGALVAGAFFVVYPSKVLRVENYESTYYRVEAFPATWEIVKQHPVFGVGIRTSRQPFLKSYQPASDMTNPEAFFGTLERNVTWDNQYLSLLCGIGVPFSLLYFWLVGRPLVQYLRRLRTFAVDRVTERALTFPVLASVIHFAVHDGLYYPQINWFFHLLLGVGVALPFHSANTISSWVCCSEAEGASCLPGGMDE